MQIKKTAKTVNIAIDEALKELDLTIDKIEYEILQEPSKGFLGIGSKPAIVLIKTKEENSLSLDLDTKAPVKNINTITVEKKIPRMVTEDTFEKENTLEKNEKQQKPINEDAPKVAEEFLKEIFENMNIKVEINSKINDKNQLFIELNGEDTGVIIGKRGQTLYSLQYLTSLVVNKGKFSYVSVSIDIEDYRERRKQTLEKLAVNLAKKAKKTRKTVSLEPMNPYERRIIHYKLQNEPGVKTYSEGDEPFRYVVITPK